MISFEFSGTGIAILYSVNLCLWALGHLLAIGIFSLSISSTAWAQNRTSVAKAADVELLIPLRTLVAENKDNSREFKIHSVLIDSASIRGPLHQIPRIGNGFEKLNIKVQEISGEYSLLDLPEHLKSQILKFLMNPPVPCDCNCFAHAANDVKFKLNTFDPASWMVAKFVGESYLYPGDTIYIEKEKDSFTHFAVYLGRGLYISKFGYAGPLIVSDLAAIQWAYDAKNAWIIRPRNNRKV